jgi:tetratricopeptide (TPR) repeat protein
MKKIKSITIIRIVIIGVAVFLIAGCNINRHLIKGMIYETEFQYNEAIKEYKKGGNSIAILNKLVALYNKTGKYDKAVEILTHIIKIKDDDMEAHFDLAGTYYAMGLFDDAIKEYEIALNLNPQSVGSLDNLGNICFDQGKVDKAVEYYKRAIAIDPNFAPAYNDLGNAYHSQNKIEEAVIEYKKALTLDVDFNLARQNLQIAEKELNLR